MDLKTLLAPIYDDLKGVDAVIRNRLASEVALINDVAGHIVHAGGKRLRPATSLLAARALGAQSEPTHTLAAVVEFIHTATLLHDDVVDQTNLRRGRITANAQWTNSAAVLSGDFLYSRAFQMMVDVNQMAVMRVMADTTNAIAEGEVLQLLNARNPDVDEARYFKVIELKTAVLFRAAAQLGAIAANGSAEQIHAMGDYGHALGMCYQLVDDVIDFESSPEESGKAVGNDLVEGKLTLPLIHALRHADAPTVAAIRSIVSSGQIADLAQTLALVRAAIDRADALTYTRNRAQTYAQAAINALALVPDSPYKTAMLALPQYCVGRRQ